jgi:REP element-mobilizing transposase RayT
MANTYSQTHYHVVFSVKNRENIFQNHHLNEIFNLIGIVIFEEDAKPLIVGGYLDHIHLLISIKPKYAVSNIVSKIKSKSNKRLKEKRLVDKNFEWQIGYSVFSVSRQDMELIRSYIKNQESHHKKIGFKEEYISLLREANIQFEECYLFDL